MDSVQPTAEILQHRPLPELFHEITETTLKPIYLFVPHDAAEQRRAFLANEVRNPHHHYDRLESVEFAQTAQTLQRLRSELGSRPDISFKFRHAYEDYMTRHIKLVDMMRIAAELQEPNLTKEQRDALRQQYMDLNIELYGQPDPDTYRNLVAEQRHQLTEQPLGGRAADIRDELLQLLPEVGEVSPRFKPTQETIDWVHEITNDLYGDMLRHVPERKEKFTPMEARDIFETIIRQEFGDVVEGWQVTVSDAQAINVKPELKTIVIPANRAAMSSEGLRDLVCHELGVHFLRSVMGEQTDLLLMRLGLDGYSDSEEGLGKVMEQARNGEYKDSGIPYYLAAGLAYFEDKDFRDVHEVMWRIKLLGSLKASQEVTDEAITKAKGQAYSQVMRIMRGTDEVAWFKDLSYYNGANSMWQHLEEIRGDDLKFMFVLLGKADPTQPAHRRVMYETRTP